jgi:hypothetical protein
LQQSSVKSERVTPTPLALVVTVAAPPPPETISEAPTKEADAGAMNASKLAMSVILRILNMLIPLFYCSTVGASVGRSLLVIHSRAYPCRFRARADFSQGKANLSAAGPDERFPAEGEV